MVGAVLGRRVTTSQVSEAGGDGKGEDREKEGRQDGCVERGVVDGARQTEIGGGWVEDGWGGEGAILCALFARGDKI